jgi:hypothetical protein
MPFAGDGSPTVANRDLAAEWLEHQFQVSGPRAQRIVDAALLPENTGRLTVWDLVNGVTRVAKEEEFAGDLVASSGLGARLLAAVE